MVALATYSDTAAVRAAVGVTDNEFSDTMFSDQNLDVELTLDLDEWLPTHATIWSEGIAGGATSAQIQKMNYLKLYSQFFFAERLAETILAIPKSHTDGKVEIKRFDKIDFGKIAADASARKSAYKLKLSDIVSPVATTRPTLAGVSVPDYDPVAG